MSNENDTDTVAVVGTTTTQDSATVVVATADDSKKKEVKEKAPAAHLAFVAAAKAHAEALGLSTKDQSQFFQVFNPNTGMKLYISKSDKAVTRIDTTLPAAALPGISYDLDKPNGRIECHVNPDLAAMETALSVLASYTEKLRAPKKAQKQS